MEETWFTKRAKRVWEKIETNLDDLRGFDFGAIDEDILQELRATQVKVIEEALYQAHELNKHGAK